jgi:hypothetical protein
MNGRHKPDHDNLGAKGPQHERAAGASAARAALRIEYGLRLPPVDAAEPAEPGLRGAEPVLILGYELIALPDRSDAEPEHLWPVADRT